MTKDEIQQAEECVQHFKEEHFGQRHPRVSRNAFTLGTTLLEEYAPEIFEDAYEYSPLQEC